MNDDHSLPVAVIRSPGYLKDVTIYRGCTYTWNVAAAPARAFSTDSRRHFMSAPWMQSAVLWWFLFIDAHGTNMSQAGQWGWGRLLYSRITIVYHMWWCTKWIRRLVRVGARPLQPSTRHPTKPAARRKETLQSLGGGLGRVDSHWSTCLVLFWSWQCAESNIAANSAVNSWHLTRYHCLSWKDGPTPVIDGNYQVITHFSQW